MVLTISDTDDCDDELANQHAESAPDEQRATAEPLNGIEGDWSGADIDESGDERNEEGVLDGAEGLEEGGAEVEDKVDTSPLLHHLKRSAENRAAQVGVGRAEAAAEAVKPGVKVVALRNDLELVLMVGDDLSKFLLDELGVNWLASKPGEHVRSEVELATLDEVTRRLWEEEEASSENQRPRHLDGDRDAVGARVKAALGAIVHTGREQDTERNAELVARDERATDLARRDLRHVQDDDGRDKADTETRNETAGNEKLVAGRGSLENDTDDEDDAAHDDSRATANEVGKITSDESPKERARRENGHDQGLLPRGERPDGAVRRVAVRQVFVRVNHVVHAQDAADIARVVAEEDTSKGREGAHQVRLQGDGRLDALDIARRDEIDSSARHDGWLCGLIVSWW